MKIERWVKGESTVLPSWIEDDAMVEEERESKLRRKIEYGTTGEIIIL